MAIDSCFHRNAPNDTSFGLKQHQLDVVLFFDSLQNLLRTAVEAFKHYCSTTYNVEIPYKFLG